MPRNKRKQYDRGYEGLNSSQAQNQAQPNPVQEQQNQNIVPTPQQSQIPASSNKDLYNGNSRQQDATQQIQIEQAQNVRQGNRKTIQYYEDLLDISEGYMYIQIQGIHSFKDSIPIFNNDSEFNTFLQFIVKLIHSIPNKSQQQQNIYNSTIFGFLEQEQLQTQILDKFQKTQSEIALKETQVCFINSLNVIVSHCYQIGRVPSLQRLINQNHIQIQPQQQDQQVNSNQTDQKQANQIRFDEQGQVIKEEIRTHHSEVKDSLYKNIKFYQEIQQLPSDQLCLRLYEIVSHQNSIPFIKDSDDLVLFLKFIDRMINIISTKKSTDLQSTKMQIDILNKTIFGFLQQETLVREIKVRINRNKNKGKAFKDKDKKYLLNEAQKISFLLYMRQIISYCNKMDRLPKELEVVANQIDQIYDINNSNSYEFPIDQVDQDDSSLDPINSVEKKQMSYKVEDIKEFDINEPLTAIIEDEEALVADKQNCQFEIDDTTNIIPSESDCRVIKNYRGNLKRIDLKTPYQDEKQYLENMFNFLRADSHQDIVHAMNEAIKIGAKLDLSDMILHKSKQMKLKVFRPLMETFHFYNNIQIINMEYKVGLNIFLSVQPILPKKIFKIKWEQTKRLLGDQYIYLTNYNFTRIIRCQVQGFKNNQLIQNLNSEYNVLRIKVKVLEEDCVQHQLVQDIQDMIANNTALILEPRLYIGQYFTCMGAIKQMVENKFNLPFKNNIIDLKRDIFIPAFINEDTKFDLDFSPLNEEVLERESFQQNLLDSWSKVPTINYLTPSQQKAVQNILTKQISLIQGPPGTGKTYVGAIAIRNLLKNSHIWNPNDNPILMVCKTNHALDQFLNHIMKFEQNVIRIGSRSKDEEIRKLQLSEIRKNFKISNSSYAKMAKLEENLNKSLVYLSDKLFNINGVKDLIYELPSDIVDRCCQLYLLEFQQFMPFIYYKLQDILMNYETKQKVVRYWWQLNPDVNELLNNLFYPLIDQYDEDYYKQERKQNLYYGLVNYYSIIENQKKVFYSSLFNDRKSELNYFFEKDSDDNADLNIISQEDINNQMNLWMNIQLRRQRVRQNNEDIEDDEYAEDRDNFVVDDNGDEDEEQGESNRSKKLKRNPKKGTQKFDEEDFLYFTYFQFIQQDMGQLYTNIELDLRQSESYIPSFYDQLVIRLQAVKKYSQQQKQTLFDQMDMAQYFTTFKNLQEEKMYSEIKIMSRSKIIAMTMGGACKYSEYLKYLKYDVLIIEEAGEVLENLTIPLLQPFLKQLILIGDHQQLKPSVNAYILEKKYNMNVSLFQRLIYNNLDFECLSEQMRMCPEFSDYVRLIYCKPNQYLDSQKVKQYKRSVRGLPSNIMFFMHNYDELQLSYTTTKKNEKEADLAIAFAQYIISQKEYQASQITILTMYLGQASMIKRKCANSSILQPIRVSTVDNYQGEENEIIILSLVRSSHLDLGYVKVSNRINVSISRAKKGFIVLGNQNLLKSQDCLWRSIFQKAKINNHIFLNQFTHVCSQHNTSLTYSTPNSLLQTKNGGCNKPCQQQNLTCGHKCKRFCHDGSCDEFECQELISYKFQKCGHENKIECYLQKKQESELQCTSLIEIQNDYCDHIQEIECYKYDTKEEKFTDSKYQQDFLNIPCKKICNKPLTCGHRCQENCHENSNSICNLVKCKFQVNKQLICGHRYSGKCGESITFRCRETVEKKILPCGHSIKNVICSIVQKCKMKCEKVLPCQHKCIEKFCFQAHRCDKKSQRELKCGHVYFGNCSDDLSNYKCEEILNIPLKCGHGYNTNRCFEREQFQCEQLDEVILKCNHVNQIQCYLKQEKFSKKCQYMCQKMLECGHKCQNACGEQCTDKCEGRVVNKKRKYCQHLVTGACYELSEKCQEDVQILGRNMKCFEKEQLNETCNKLLSCGHRCKEKSLDKCKCKEKIALQCCDTVIYCFLKENHDCEEDNFI